MMILQWKYKNVNFIQEMIYFFFKFLKDLLLLWSALWQFYFKILFNPNLNQISNEFYFIYDLFLYLLTLKQIKVVLIPLTHSFNLSKSIVPTKYRWDKSHKTHSKSSVCLHLFHLQSGHPGWHLGYAVKAHTLLLSRKSIK